MQRAPLQSVDIAVDRGFEPKDAFRATMQAQPPPPPQPHAQPHLAPRSRTVWWPLLLIGFVAIMCGTIAFMKSPLAQHPRVAPYADAVLAKIL